MYPQVVQFETRRLQVARELQLIREREGRKRDLETAVGSIALKSSRLRTLLGGPGSPLRRKAAIARKSP